MTTVRPGTTPEGFTMAAADPELRRLIAQKASSTYHATLDEAGRRAQTEAARAELQRRFEAEVDPDGTLSDEERQRRAGHLRRAQLAELSIQGVLARRRKAADRRRVEELAELDELAGLELSA